MPWIRFPTWERWGELTRFRVALETALAAEQHRWNSLPIAAPDGVTITDPVPGGEFRCSLANYKAAFGDSHLLYSMLLAAYTGLIEEHGRNLIEYALTEKGIARTAFASLHPTAPVEQAAEEYISKCAVEVWGRSFFALKAWSWNDFGGGEAGVVEAFTLRNITSHGSSEINSRAINRMVAAGCDATKWQVGQPVSLSREQFNDCLRSLRAFGRSLSDCVANL